MASPLVGLSLADLESLAEALGEPRYRGRQVAEWIYRKRAPSIAAMGNLPARFRERLGGTHTVYAADVAREETAGDGTRKMLVRFPDGQSAETVWIPGKGRVTACISSQVGCAVRCSFCASGLDGVVRDLTAAEILQQYFLQGVRTGTLPDHVVFMGMGEPFFNADEVWKAVEVLRAPWGGALGARHVTISTSGVVPGILDFAGRGTQVRLSVSLHAVRDDLRDRLVPINRKWPLDALAAALQEYVEKTHRQVTFEYVLLAGVNDSPADAMDLAAWTRRFPSSVNLIPYNAVPEFPHKPPTRDAARAFAAALRDQGVRTTIRLRRGDDIAGACGQLRLRDAGREGFPGT